MMKHFGYYISNTKVIYLSINEKILVVAIFYWLLLFDQLFLIQSEYIVVSVACAVALLITGAMGVFSV